MLKKTCRTDFNTNVGDKDLNCNMKLLTRSLDYFGESLLQSFSFEFVASFLKNCVLL